MRTVGTDKSVKRVRASVDAQRIRIVDCFEPAMPGIVSRQAAVPIGNVFYSQAKVTQSAEIVFVECPAKQTVNVDHSRRA